MGLANLARAERHARVVVLLVRLRLTLGVACMAQRGQRHVNLTITPGQTESWALYDRHGSLAPYEPI